MLNVGRNYSTFFFLLLCVCKWKFNAFLLYNGKEIIYNTHRNANIILVYHCIEWRGRVESCGAHFEKCHTCFIHFYCRCCCCCYNCFCKVGNVITKQKICWSANSYYNGFHFLLNRTQINFLSHLTHTHIHTIKWISYQTSTFNVTNYKM